jgi:ArsR family transcriptional regulator, arsenate/arsenite/antimonite-responsive transcriptional repressor
VARVAVLAPTLGAPAVDEGRCCVAPGGVPLTEAQAAELSAKFKALADPKRLTILSIVAASGAEETCVCDIQEPLDLSQPTVSHHLKILVDAGLLAREKRGVWAYYSLVPGALEALAATLVTPGA